jgi:hypothetical protein
MLTKQHLPNIVLAALARLGGSGSVVEVAREVWLQNEAELRASGDLFYTWQYDLRWAALHLRKEGQLKPTARGAASRWTLAGS